MGDGKSEIMRSYENTCNRFHKRLMMINVVAINTFHATVTAACSGHWMLTN